MNTVENDALTQRVEQLEKQIAEQVTPRFDDVQDQYAAALSRIEEYFSRTEKVVIDAHNELTNALDEIRKKFLERVQEEITKVTAADIAQALAKKILVTRHATQAELRDPNAEILKIRQATSAEINQR